MTRYLVIFRGNAKFAPPCWFESLSQSVGSMTNLDTMCGGLGSLRVQCPIRVNPARDFPSTVLEVGPLGFLAGFLDQGSEVWEPPVLVKVPQLGQVRYPSQGRKK